MLIILSEWKFILHVAMKHNDYLNEYCYQMKTAGENWLADRNIWKRVVKNEMLPYPFSLSSVNKFDFAVFLSESWCELSSEQSSKQRWRWWWWCMWWQHWWQHGVGQQGQQHGQQHGSSGFFFGSSSAPGIGHQQPKQTRFNAWTKRLLTCSFYCAFCQGSFYTI